ncbi:Amidase [Stylophora pistillata]|uniref:Amidase n=1 Tax=Stylophora pistillata TaxID=50429 RepID=A0A2B4RHN6_STYPI|nr:Amidase [Stylophora pistillata]
MKSTYKEKVVKPPSTAQLTKIAAELGYDLGGADIQEFKDVIDDSLLATYQRFNEIPDPKLPVKYPRTPGYRPTGPKDNPYNAWYCRCDIPGAPNGNLHGKTIAIKDCICVAGVPMMMGSQILEGYIPDVDATVVTRILDAGGHITGKAVCENLCNSGGSFNAATGPVVHPLDETRMTGGSSSGCAALVTGGHVDMAVGADQGGSVRNPAGRCGIVGLKPTLGLIPYTGVVPMEFSLDHVGLMARTVHDVALLLEVTAGSDDGLDYRQPHGLRPETYVNQLTSEISHLRLGLLTEGFSRPQSEPDVDECIKKAAKRLATETRATLQDVSVPMHLDGYQVTSLQKWFAQGLKTRANDLSADYKVTAIKGRYLQSNYNDEFYFKARNLAWKLREVFDEVLTKVDVLIMPTNPKKARPLPPPNISLREYMTCCSENYINTCTFNMTGHPALSINAGVSDGLPVGMMIVGRKFDEATVLNVGYAYEKIRKM